jgi:hypothetical protein
MKVNSAQENQDKEVYSFARWLSWLFLSGFIGLLLYTYYRAEIFYDGKWGTKYFKYYVLSLTGILFWGIVLRLKEKVQANILLANISLIVGLYLMEGGLRYYFPDRITVAARLGVKFDKRRPLEVKDELKAKGIDTVPAVKPDYFHKLGGLTGEKGTELLYPLGGVSRRTTVYGNESGKWVIYKSDRYGFNNPDEEWDSSQVELVLIGDSFTQGASVQTGEEIAGQIRSITNHSTISLGMGGNGPLIELAALKEYGESIRPKKVLWIYFDGNDLKDLSRELNTPMLMKYLQNNFSQNLINKQKELDTRLNKYIAEQEIIRRGDEKLLGTGWIRLSLIRELLMPKNYDIEYDKLLSKTYKLFPEILKAAKTRTEAWGGNLYFVYLPAFQWYSTPNFGEHANKKKVIEIVQGLKIPIIDIQQEVFAKHPDPLALFPLRINGHYNAEGYSKVAKAIVDNVN